MGHLHLAPQRHGDVWDVDDYETLCDALATYTDDLAVASVLGREITDIQSAARFLLPPGIIERLPEASRLPYLRGVLLDPDYPWLEHLQENNHGMTPPWPKGGDRALAQFWDQGDSLDFVAESLGAPEMQVALRCVRLGLAKNLAEVVETMGAGSDPAVQARANMMVERDEAALDVYVDIQDGGEVAVYLAPPGAPLPPSCRRRADGSFHQWMKVPSVAPGEVESA